MRISSLFSGDEVFRMKDCPQCKGSGITRLDWVKVPIWQACACTPSPILSVPLNWNWVNDSQASRPKVAAAV